MMIIDIIWNILRIAAIFGLLLFVLNLVPSLIARKWRLVAWRKDYGDSVSKVVDTKRAVLRDSVKVGVVGFGLIVVVGLFSKGHCINAIYKNKPDYLSYCN